MSASVGSGWRLSILRDDPEVTRLDPVPVPTIGDGEVLMSTSLAAITANSIAYAELGNRLGYWNFYPTPEPWGTPPMWGFTDVVDSKVESIHAGDRYYGFIPAASHFVTQPRVISEGRFRDVSGMRPSMPSSYSNFLHTGHDPSYYPPEREDVQVVFRGLYITGWALADTITSAGDYGAEALLFSSASAKTAYCTAWTLAKRADRPRIVGLTSTANRDFVESLGCYDQVHVYDDVSTLSRTDTTAYVDFAGSLRLRERLSDHLGASLTTHLVGGLTHHEGILDPSSASDPTPEFWFCPDYLTARGKELGPGVLHSRFSADYPEAVSALAASARYEYLSGGTGLQQAWTSVITGTVPSGGALIVELP